MPYCAEGNAHTIPTQKPSVDLTEGSFSLFKNLISSMRHPLKELRGRHVVSIQFFVLE